MRILIQRVKEASVHVEDRCTGKIGRGLLIFVGIGDDDTEDDINYISNKVANLRIFEDGNGKMNLNISQIEGSILSISQFTLHAETAKGNRPGFGRSAAPEIAKTCWENLNEALLSKNIPLERGVFGAHMEVKLVNDGPVTIWLDSRSK